MLESQAPKLEPREEHFRIPRSVEGLRLFLRYLPIRTVGDEKPKIEFHVHGGTFPSALSIAHRFDGHSWRDELADAGFHVWGFDFHDFGLSDPYPEMAEPANVHAVLGCADTAGGSIETDVTCKRYNGEFKMPGG